MPGLVYRSAARSDIAELAAHIARESESLSLADDFVEKLTDFCEHLASLPGLMGRQRAELRPDYRSVTFGSYVIFMRYADEAGPRSHLYILRVLHGARDIEAFFSQTPDDDRD